ncbi:MAG: UDP-glucose 4-epimerase [Candidatus Latescibacterota bacterium]|jgi:UDP-glucose 4-epimerase
MKKRVLVTGAAGKIAGQVLPALRERYDLTLLDVRTTDRDGQHMTDVQIADLVDGDRDAYRHHFKDIDAVAHFGHMGSTNPAGSGQDARFRAEMQNVEMAYNIYRVALEEGVERVVMASSNHAADYYESLILDGEMDCVDPNSRAQSDNYYGWAKETYEHLGFVFAVGKGNDRPLPNVQIRIGGPRETDVGACTMGDLRCMRRALAAYLSARDMQQLFVKSIETEDIADVRGVSFQIFYGISDNPHAFWSIANARQVIGYAPEDNSERRFADIIARHLAVAQERDGYPEQENG